MLGRRPSRAGTSSGLQIETEAAANPAASYLGGRTFVLKGGGTAGRGGHELDAPSRPLAQLPPGRWLAGPFGQEEKGILPSGCLPSPPVQ